MNEKIFEMLVERLDRLEGKLDGTMDRLMDKQQKQAIRLTKLESQAGFVKYTLGVLGTLVLAMAGMVLDWLKK